MLKTKHREKRLLETCLEITQPFVVDNTNPTPEERKRYIEPAKERNFQIIGYYFESKVTDSLQRDRNRPLKQQIPEKGIRGTYARLILPKYAEGFDELYYVRLLPERGFIVEQWTEEI